VVCLLGPRQCGKTTIAKIYQTQQKKHCYYLDLESPSDLRKLSDPELLFTENPDSIFILDEVQRMPELFALLRSVIDRKRIAGRFLLLGSANPDLIRGVSESLAGRIAYIHIFPFHFTEIAEKPHALRKHWLRGGFPDAYLAKTDAAAATWMAAFVRTFIERDLNTLFGVGFSTPLMFKLWRMLAHHHGGIWNAQSFAKGLDISPTTVNRYIDYLEGAFVVRKLMPYHINVGKRLVKSPKVYICDTGILHHLLDIRDYKTLQVHPIVGYSWESYIIEQICQRLPQNIQPFFYRTHDGSEIDLVLVKGIKPLCCIEIKWSHSPNISKGMTESIKDLKCKKNYIIIPSDESVFPMRKDIYMVGFKYFMIHILPSLLK
jgi:predicted AAA+ superfamily ATPase